MTSNLLLGALGGYAFARMRFAGSRALLALMLATMAIPFQLTMIPTFLVMKWLGLIDTLGALIVPSLVTPFAVFLLRQFFLSLPRELEEAAWIDGCSRLRVLFSIVLPLSRPALSTVAVLTFLTTWNDLTWPLIAINHDTHYTLQLGLTTFQGQHHTQWSAVMAGNVITVLPVLLAFLVRPEVVHPVHHLQRPQGLTHPRTRQTVTLPLGQPTPCRRPSIHRTGESLQPCLLLPTQPAPRSPSSARAASNSPRGCSPTSSPSRSSPAPT